jgi:hypothetical protein
MTGGLLRLKPPFLTKSMNSKGVGKTNFQTSVASHSFAAVIIDTRLDVRLLAAVSNARRHIPTQRPIYVVTSDENKKTLSELIRQLDNVYVVDEYNYESKVVCW